MKAKLIVFIICVSLASVMQAQVKDKSNSFLLSASAGISGEFKPALSLKVIYSHEYNYFFAIGVGAGAHYQNYRLQNEIDSYSLDLPVFVNIRGNFKSNSSSKVMPYYSLNLGMFSNLMKVDDEYLVVKSTQPMLNGSYCKHSKYYEGLFLSPEIGVSIKDMSLGIEFLYGTLKEEQQFSYSTSNLVRFEENTKPSYVISFKFTQKL